MYFDHSATTPLNKEVFSVMQDYFIDNFANPSAMYSLGQKSRFAIDESRSNISKILNCSPLEIIFTSGGTESNNLAIKGFCLSKRKGEILTTQIEHPSVLEVMKYLETEGFKVKYLPVDQYGLVDPQLIEESITDQTIFASIMYANNEIATIQNISKIGKILKKNKIIFHCDAVQAASLLPLDVQRLNVDLLTVSGHKIYGPKGSGLLYCRSGVNLLTQMHGGGQEFRYRSGTENTTAIVGLSKALSLVSANLVKNNKKIKILRDYFIDELLKKIPSVKLNSSLEHCLVNNANLYFPHLTNDSLLMSLDLAGVSVSAGSACSSGMSQPSPVLLAIGKTADEARHSLRFSFGEGNTKAEVEQLIVILEKILNK